MSQGINAGFARSEQLKTEWETLRSEILSLPSDNPANISRRNAIQARMSQITADMSAVLSETRKLIPTPDIDADADESYQNQDGSPAFIQYSKNHLHVIQRTYESSDSEDELEEKEGVGSTGVGEEDVPEAPVWHGDMVGDEHLDVDELREEMRGGKEDNPGVIVVEGKGGEKGLRMGLGELKLKLKDRLKLDSSGGMLSEEERETLTLEQSRLEREVRRLKRLGGERTRQEDKKLEEMTTRIGKIREKFGNVKEDEGGGEDEKAKGRVVAKVSQRLERRKTVIFGRGTRGEKREDARKVGEGSEESTVPSKSELSATGSEKSCSHQSQGQGHGGTSSKRKKGWLALEAGVASIRVLGRNLRGGGKTKEKEGGGLENGGDGVGRGKEVETSKRSGGAESNAFAETARKMQERGEKLGSTAEGSERMAKDAGDMLAAVRALKQKNQRGGFFS